MMRRSLRLYSAVLFTSCFTLLTAASLSAAPSAVDDIVPGDADGPITGSVLANDDATSPATAELVAAPVYGTLTGDGTVYGGVTPWGDFEYQPAPGFTGVDVFAYRVRSGHDASAAATVYVLVGPV